MLRLDNLTEILLYSAALLGYLPLAPWLQRFPALAVPAAIIFAAVAGRRGLVLRERPALLVSAGCFLYYAVQFNHHNVVVPAANLLAILLAIRLAGDKSSRNVLQTIVLALFCLAASTLFDLSPRFIIYLLLLLLILTVSLVLLTFRSAAPDFKPAPGELRAILAVALAQPLTALPLIVFLFFILPRTQFPLWQGLSLAGSDRTGISDTVQPGDKSAITGSTATMFRAEMPQLPPEDLYWRVTVLNALDGDRWVRRQPPAEGQSRLAAGSELHQTIFLEPGRITLLPALNIPASISRFRGGPTIDRLFAANALGGGRRSYSVVSRGQGAVIATARIDQQFYTILPVHVPPRLLALSRAVAAREKSGAQRLRLLQDAFINLKLSYAASGLPTGADALDTFLFVGKKGHCELFATAFATALRGAGVPARLVGGYYGGVYNDLAGYYAVAEERAHLWVEAWLEGKGWVTVDPSRYAANFDEARRPRASALALRLQLLADTLSYYWNRAVITYDLESQFSAVSRAGEGLRSLKSGALPLRRLAIGGGLLLLLAAAIYLATRRKATPEERLLQAFRRALQKKFGLVIAPSSGLHEAVRGLDSEAIQEFVTIYTGAIYRDRSLTEAEIMQLKSLLEEIRGK
jgi:hypothetical protein